MLGGWKAGKVSDRENGNFSRNQHGEISLNNMKSDKNAVKSCQPAHDLMS